MLTKDLFDRALSLSEDERLVIPCNNSRQRESMCTQLYRERARWKESTGAREDIIINKETREGKYFIILTKVPGIPPAMVLDEEGNVKEYLIQKTITKEDPQDLIPDLPECPAMNISEDIARIKEAMLQDGATEEEIEDFLKGCSYDEA